MKNYSSPLLILILMICVFILGYNCRNRSEERKKETEILSLKEIKSDLARILPASVKEKCDGYKKIDSLIIQKEKELGIK